jgi:CDP-paratose 2-epimerase
MKVLVTGSSGLIGSEAVSYFDSIGAEVHGVDNNMRQTFFGPDGDTTWRLNQLRTSTKRFHHWHVDIRDYEALAALFAEHDFDLILHSAAQPSHDKAKEMPRVDFDVNAVATLNLLELTRLNRPDAVFVHMSTNKVYGDAPNDYDLVELPTRWDFARDVDRDGIDEHCRIDRSTHSLFGASKVAADVLAQEYGRYFGMRVGVFRCGCLTGPSHSGAELHGFLSYLVRATLEGRQYHIFGYKGKQVRDNIHSADLIAAVDLFARDPRCGEVYNLGGGRQNSLSVLEAIENVQSATGRRLDYIYEDQARTGDHICYISKLDKFKSHFRTWSVTKSLDHIIGEVVAATTDRLIQSGR